MKSKSILRWDFLSIMLVVCLSTLGIVIALQVLDHHSLIAEPLMRGTRLGLRYTMITLFCSCVVFFAELIKRRKEKRQ